MEFRTEITPAQLLAIDQHSSVVSIGSCFADHMGNQLIRHGFYVLNNPFGNIFHPIPMADLLKRALHEKYFALDDAQCINQRYFLWQTHGQISNTTAESLIVDANAKLTALRTELLTAKLLLITFGTAWGYTLKSSSLVVANCHKAPGNLFYKECTSLGLLTQAWNQLLHELREFNPEMRIITSVSPVRHWKDGAEGNSKSKAILRLLCDALAANENAMYFPAFELVTDDLRDYRFYADDLLHPTPFAVQYVWQKFAQACLNAQAIQVGTEVEKLHRFLSHRPIHDSNSDAVSTITEKIMKLQMEHPFLNLPKH